MKTSTYNEARGVVDAEYGELVGWTKDELWDYLSSMFPELTKEESNKIWITMLS